MSILGNRVVRKEDPKFLTVGGSYVDDLPLPGAAYVTYVRSTVPHARITSVDVDEARKAPGVIDAVTGADVDLPPLTGSGFVNAEFKREWLATDITRFVGEPIVAIVSETRAQGADAAELVSIDYDPLPAVIHPEDALADGAPLLFEAVGSNLALEFNFGRDEGLFDGCEIVVRQRIVNQRVAPCPLEVRSGAAQWGDDGRLTWWVSTQNAHSSKSEACKYLELEPHEVRAIAPDVGGGFGAKIGTYPEEILVPWFARRLGRPVKWTENRSESMLNLGHGRGQVQYVELGGDRDGTLKAYRLNLLQDAGAYPSAGAVLPFMTRTMLTGVYAIPKGEFRSRSVVTNTTPTVAYRGAGRPEATAAIERAVDIFANEIGMDPADLRARNLVTKDKFPYTTPTGTTYDTGDYERALSLAQEAAGYAELRAEQQRRRADEARQQLGVGISVYVEITAGPGAPREFGAVDVLPDGKFRVRTGVSPHGQGHHTSLAMIAADKLGVDIDDVEVVHGDTDIVPRGQGTMGSRSLQAGGSAVSRAAQEVIDNARRIAADSLEANVDDVEFDAVTRSFHVAGTPAVTRSWSDVLAAADAKGESLSAEHDYRGGGPTFPFGAHIAVVEVDTDTGRVDLQRMIAVDDAGRILNPLLADGQIHGGLAQGVAQALLEEVRYDPDGNPITSNLADYAFISAPELPSFERISMETPTPMNELGAKGIGESGSIGSTPAVQNAVIDALASFDVRHLDMPATPERVWRAMRGEREPERWEPGASAGTGSVTSAPRDEDVPTL